MSWIPPTKTQIRKWSFDALSSQGAEWGRGVPTVAGQHGVISQQLADSPGFWRGDTGDAMRAKSEEAKSSLAKVVEAFDKAEPAVSQIAYLLSFAKSTAVNAIQAAEDQRYTVSETGKVTYDPAVLAWLMAKDNTEKSVAEAALNQGARQHEEVITKALGEAGDAAASAREAIDKIFADVPIPPNAKLDEIINNYQVEPEEGKLVRWPDTDLQEQLKEKLKNVPLIGDWLANQVPAVEWVTPSEAEMLNKLSLADQAKFIKLQYEAKSACEELYPDPFTGVDSDGDGKDDNNTQDNHTDAFRHAYWNALMTQEFGEEWTKEYTTKHEGREDNRAAREAMDLYNNELGRKIAAANPDLDSDGLKEAVQKAVDNGQAVVVDRNQQLGWSNKIPEGQTVDSEAWDASEQFQFPGTQIPDNRPSPK
ncbi:DUF6973 domain-containing protein [Nocardia goodfellowii]